MVQPSSGMWFQNKIKAGCVSADASAISDQRIGKWASGQVSKWALHEYKGKEAKKREKEAGMSYRSFEGLDAIFEGKTLLWNEVLR